MKYISSTHNAIELVIFIEGNNLNSNFLVFACLYMFALKAF